MSAARSTTTVRIPTSRLRPAVEAALEAYRSERWAKIDAAVQVEMSRPEPTGWWGRRFGKRPAATRDEALARVKAQRDEFPSWSVWTEVWYDGTGEAEKLLALADACALGLDAVDVAVADVALFKAHYDPRAEGYR